MLVDTIAGGVQPRPIAGSPPDAGTVAAQLAATRVPHATVLSAIDLATPWAPPVRQGQLAELRDSVIAHAGGEREITSAADPNLAGSLGGLLGGGSDYGFFDKIIEIIRGLVTPLPMHLNAVVGPEAAGIISQSPTLTSELKLLEKQGWQVSYGTAGGGTFADRTTKTITIDPNDKSDPLRLAQSVAHEAGHAGYDPKFDYTSSKTYLKGALGDEGEATLNNIKVQREILAHGGPDIGIAGEHAKQYGKIYDHYLKTGDRAAARDAIGQLFKTEHTSTTGQTYEKYYLEGYHRAFPHRK